ncbi:MAG: hypothetical protein AAF927_29365 [Bacteroidota bacterium]
MLPSEINHNKRWKYAQREFERRFLLEERPANLKNLDLKQIEDKYLDGTRLRLRKASKGNEVQYKLTKKLSLANEPANWVSTIYLSQEEYEFFRSLSGKSYRKCRYYIKKQGEASIGIDEIKTQQGTIYLAEVEFESLESMERYQFPLAFLKEVTEDGFYSGFAIAQRLSQD